MEAAVARLSEIIRQSMNKADVLGIISVVLSSFSIIVIAVLLIERFERKRPYLQASFELIRSNSACIVIRNVGEVPAILKAWQFNSDFVDQLDTIGKKIIRDREDLCISIYPGQK
jgi:hypothetical protein